MRIAARIAAVCAMLCCALRADGARDVPLRDVRDFVRRRRPPAPIRCGTGEHRAVVDADETARQRERVDRAFAHRGRT